MEDVYLGAQYADGFFIDSTAEIDVLSLGQLVG